MRVTKFSLGLIVLLAMFVASDQLLAQRLKNLPFRKAQPVQPDDEFKLSQSDGPWLIMCASFGGDNGMADAKRLAAELRDMKLRAYVFQHDFDRPDTIEGIGWEKYTNNQGSEDFRPKRMKHASAQFEEIAVLVGDFPSVQDARAQRILEEVKRIKPKSLEHNEIPTTSTDELWDEQTSDGSGWLDDLRNWREMARFKSADPENKVKGPLGAAFLLPNPMLPDEYFAANRVDHFVMNLNKRVKHSLLENPYNYSVRVATFRGDATFELNEMEEKKQLLKFGKPDKSSKLAEAAHKAHRLTTELRKLGVDAYEFHDRNESIVCVGGFEWLTRGEGNQQVFNPDVAKVVEKFKGSFADVPNMKGAIQPRQLPQLRKTDITFDMQPLPVQVPKMQETASRQALWR